jgi:XRE family transcriptional regulator, regulator of sulfur utilization
MTLRLREWRDRRGESLYTLAEKSGVHFVTISRIEQGHLSPTVATLEKLANGLRITVRDFFHVERRKARRSK